MSHDDNETGVRSNSHVYDSTCLYGDVYVHADNESIPTVANTNISPGKPALCLLHPDTIEPNASSSNQLELLQKTTKPDTSTGHCSSKHDGNRKSAVSHAIPYVGSGAHAPRPSTKENAASANTDEEKRRKREHYYNNREKILAYAKQRYRDNRDRLLQYSKDYQSQRKDEVKVRNASYYQKNKELLLAKRSEKVMCACGKMVTRGSMSGHLKTSLHAKRLADASSGENESQENQENQIVLPVT